MTGDPDGGAPGGRGRRRREGLLGLALALALLAAYQLGWQRVRRAIVDHAAHPLLAAAADPAHVALVRPPGQPLWVLAVAPEALPRARAAGVLVDGRDYRHVPGVAAYTAPAGVLFALPAAFLIAVFPRRRYWLLLLGYHLAMGIVSLLVFAAGVAGVPGAFEVHVFATTYVVEMVSLAVPLLLYLAGRGAPAVSRGAAAENRGLV